MLLALRPVTSSALTHPINCSDMSALPSAPAISLHWEIRQEDAVVITSGLVAVVVGRRVAVELHRTLRSPELDGGASLLERPQRQRLHDAVLVGQLQRCDLSCKCLGRQGRLAGRLGGVDGCLHLRVGFARDGVDGGGTQPLALLVNPALLIEVEPVVKTVVPLDGW